MNVYMCSYLTLEKNVKNIQNPRHSVSENLLIYS